MYTIALVLALSTAGSVLDAKVFSAVVADIRRNLKSVREVRVFIDSRTATLSLKKLERLATEGPKDDPPDALALVKLQMGFDDLLRANKYSFNVPKVSDARMVNHQPRKLRCSGSNWEKERDVYIHFSRPAFIGSDRALVYAYVKDCISFGHQIIILGKTGSSWRETMSFEVAGMGE